MAAPAVRLEHVSVGYSPRVLAVEDVSLSLAPGGICALIGMNGSGKSTLFKTIMGLLLPREGRVTLAGMTPEAAQRALLVAYVPQADEVDWTFPVSAWDVAMMGRQRHMGLLRMPRAADRAAVEESLARVGMAGFAERQIGALSGGQRRRVFLARALAQRASIVLLDEPFTGVDATTERQIIDVLHGMRRDGCRIVVSTHNLASVPEFCDEVAILNRRLIAFGPARSTLTQENLARSFALAPPVSVVPGGGHARAAR